MVKNWVSEEGDWGELDWFLGNQKKGDLEVKVFASHDDEADYPDGGNPPIVEWVWCVRTIGEFFEVGDKIGNEQDDVVVLVSGRSKTVDGAKQAAERFLVRLAHNINSSLG